MEPIFVAIWGIGGVLLAGGLTGIVGFAFLPRGPQQLRLAGLAFRAVGLGLGSIWLPYGLLMLSYGFGNPVGLMLGVLLTTAGSIAIWASLRTRRPLG